MTTGPAPKSQLMWPGLVGLLGLKASRVLTISITAAETQSHDFIRVCSFDYKGGRNAFTRLSSSCQKIVWLAESDCFCPLPQLSYEKVFRCRAVPKVLFHFARTLRRSDG